MIDQAETALFTAKVPTSEPKYLVVHPTAYSELRMIDRFTEADKVGPLAQAIDTGVLGRIKDFFVYRSQFVVQTGTGTVTTNNLAFTRTLSGWWCGACRNRCRGRARSRSMRRWATSECAW